MWKILLTALCLILLAITHSAFAHESETDGPFTVFLHVEPTDEPETFETSTLHFNIFSDQLFDPHTCNCTVSVAQNNKTLLSNILTPAPTTSDFTFATHYNFPATGTYHILFSGKPKDGKAFEKFSVVFDLEVRDKSSVEPLIAGSLGAIAVLGTILVIREKTKKTA